MKFTYNWLKEFVNLKIPAQELADKLTMAGLEVGSVKPAGSDYVFEAEITSNRPDWLSIAGIAQEVAALTGQKIKPRPCKDRIRAQGKSARFSIGIENKKDCPLYAARIIRDVKVGPSPAWLRARLELIGCRSINNIVDIANYIMFTWGEPLHAFDLDKLNTERIIVRRARPGERIILIDGQEKSLDGGILVIADRDKPVAIAGVMGGRETEVTEGTQSILLEAAVFNPALVRSGKRKLGLESESSYRFERGVDSEKAGLASSECAKLIQELAQGRCVFSKSSGYAKAKNKKITLDAIRVQKILNLDINQATIKKILDSLGFKTKTQGKINLAVEVPSWRQDVSLEEDLLEEIARIFGYEKIPVTLPEIIPHPGLSRERELVLKTKNILAGLGLNEIVTYSLVSRDLLKSGQNQDIQSIEIANPLSKEQEILRPSLIPGLLKCVAYNLNQREGYVNIFEIAKGFLKSADSKPQEELCLGIALCGTKTSFLEQGLLREEVGFLHLKGILEVLFERLGIKEQNFKAQNSAQINIHIRQEKIGTMFCPSISALNSLDIKNKKAVLLELSLDRLFAHADLTRRFAPLPAYPAISRDVSFILKDELGIEELIKSIQDKAGPLLRRVEIADYYKGKQIAPGFKGLTISCIYRSDQRTLTESEINPIHSGVVELLKSKFQAQIR